MPTFIYKCKSCGEQEHYDEPVRGMFCLLCDGPIVRDYRSENAGLLRENIRAVPRG